MQTDFANRHKRSKTIPKTFGTKCKWLRYFRIIFIQSGFNIPIQKTLLPLFLLDPRFPLISLFSDSLSNRSFFLLNTKCYEKKLHFVDGGDAHSKQVFCIHD